VIAGSLTEAWEEISNSVVEPAWEIYGRAWADEASAFEDSGESEVPSRSLES
jgi:hypothetical protein